MLLRQISIARMILLMLGVATAGLLQAQDGSDIYYIKIQDIDSSQIGRYVHLDFGSKSFHGIETDTIDLDIAGFNGFKEVRKDDFYNQWFSEQYLESVAEKNGLSLRIEKMKLLNVSTDSLAVKLFGRFYMNEQEMHEQLVSDTIKFVRKALSYVLVDAKPRIRTGLSIYQVYRKAPQFNVGDELPDCLYCFSPHEEELFDSPLIADYEVEKFDFEKQQMFLNPRGQRSIEDLEIPVEGLPVVMTLNGEILYGFWLWVRHSSVGSDFIYSFPKEDFKIIFGKINQSEYGSDPWFDPRFKEYLENRK